VEQRDTFDAVAGLYAEVRPGYPEALYDDLWSLAGLTGAARVLEVGCGGGQATGDLAARAAYVLAVDPGERLIAEARKRVPAAHVDYAVARFEAFDPPASAFDLVASAQAWHWIDPLLSHAKAAAALCDGGWLAIFGHVPLPPAEPDLQAAFEAAYDRLLPGAWGAPPPQAAYRPDGPFAAMIEASGLFGPVTHRSYAWTWPLDPEALGRYLRTDSSYHALPQAQRFALFDALSAAVADAGAVWRSPWETHLYLARKA
jgi:SAM-dependent methyltransferase